MSSLSSLKTKEELLINSIKEGNQNQVDELLALFMTENNNKEKVQDRKKNGAIYVGLISIKSNSQGSEEKKRREKIVKDLIKAGFPINTKNRVGKTPLHKAVKKELFEIIELLINKGADLNAKNCDGETPFHLSLKRGSEKVTEILIKRGADINDKNIEGETPLFLAVSERNLKLFKCLIMSPKIDLYDKVRSPLFGDDKEMNILEVLENSIGQEELGQEEISGMILKEMLKIFLEQIKRLNYRVLKVNKEPRKYEPEHETLFEKVRNGKRKIFVSYYQDEEESISYCTIPMVDDFCELMEEKGIEYFRDAYPTRGLEKIGGNIEKFIEQSTMNSHLTVAFINEHYLSSWERMSELSKLWDPEKNQFYENLFIIMHPDFQEVYSNQKKPQQLKKYVNVWIEKVKKVEQEDSTIQTSYKGTNYVSKAKFLNEVVINISQMIEYLSDHVFPSYEEIRNRSYFQVFEKALQSEKTLGELKLNKGVKKQINFYNNKTKELNEEIERVQIEIENTQKIRENECKQIKDSIIKLEEEIQELKKQRNELSTTDDHHHHSYQNEKINQKIKLKIKNYEENLLKMIHIQNQKEKDVEVDQKIIEQLQKKIDEQNKEIREMNKKEERSSKIDELNMKVNVFESQIKELVQVKFDELMKEINRLMNETIQEMKKEIEDKKNEIKTLNKEKNNEEKILDSEMKILMMIKEESEEPQRIRLEELRNKHKELSIKLITNESAISLNSNKTKNEEIEMIQLELRLNNNQIKSLDLNLCNIEDEGTKNIASVLKYNNSLTKLGLRSNNIGNEGLKSIANALKINTSLKKLDLGFNKIGDEGLKIIVDALNINTSLIYLDLGFNKIGDEGLKCISDTLKINTSLTELHLGSNKIGDEGLKSIVEALKINTSLIELDLVFNNIGDEGLKSIAEALKINTSLMYLDLGSNKIGDEGLKSISDALKINTSLMYLELGGNNIGDEGLKSIVDLLKINTSLMELHLDNNPINDRQTLLYIHSKLDQNFKFSLINNYQSYS